MADPTVTPLDRLSESVEALTRGLGLMLEVQAKHGAALERIEAAMAEEPGESPVAVGAPVSLERLEVEHVRRVLAAAPSLDEAARTLGIDPSTLYRKRKQHGL